MKKVLSALVLSSTLLFSGCSTLLPLAGGTSVAQQAGKVSVKTEQLLTVAHLAYQALGQQLLNNTANGLLKGANAATVKTWYDKAGDALVTADSFDAAANDNGVISALEDVDNAIAKAKALVGS